MTALINVCVVCNPVHVHEGPPCTPKAAATRAQLVEANRLTSRRITVDGIVRLMDLIEEGQR